MPSINERIAQAIYDLMIEADVAEGQIYRSREEALAKNQMPAVVIKPETEDSEVFATGTDERHFNLSLDVLVRGEPWDCIADPVAVAAHAAITADPSVGGIAARIRLTGKKWDGTPADSTAGTLTLHYLITYLSASNTL